MAVYTCRIIAVWLAIILTSPFVRLNSSSRDDANDDQSNDVSLLLTLNAAASAKQQEVKGDKGTQASSKRSHVSRSCNYLQASSSNCTVAELISDQKKETDDFYQLLVMETHRSSGDQVWRMAAKRVV